MCIYLLNLTQRIVKRLQALSAIILRRFKIDITHATLASHVSLIFMNEVGFTGLCGLD